MYTPEPARTNLEEDLLVDKFRGGDRTAFDVLYERYKNRIHNFIYRMIGNRQVAEELTQEVFINVYMNIGSYQPKGLLKAWVYTIASNAAKNELKRRSYRKDISLFRPLGSEDGDIELNDILASGSFSPDSLVENEELKEEIENALKSLPAIYREVITLCVIEGLSYEESGRILKINVKTVSSRLARARKRFIRRIRAVRKA